MDILAWSVKNQHSRFGRFAICVMWAIGMVMSVFKRNNWDVCNSFVQGIHRSGDPKVIVCLDGLRDAGNRARELDKKGEYAFWLAGNEREQALFLSLYRPVRLYQFSVSENTLDQAQKVLAKAMEEGVDCLGVMDYEFHGTRTIMTLIKQAKRHGVRMLFVPFIYVDNDRRRMYWVLRELGCITEAIKLRKYQRKGHVATLQEGMDYYSELGAL